MSTTARRKAKQIAGVSELERDHGELLTSVVASQAYGVSPESPGSGSTATMSVIKQNIHIRPG